MAAVATVIAGGAATVAAIAAVVPGGQGVAVGSGILAGAATVVAGVASLIDAKPTPPMIDSPMPPPLPGAGGNAHGPDDLKEA